MVNVDRFLTPLPAEGGPGSAGGHEPDGRLDEWGVQAGGIVETDQVGMRSEVGGVEAKARVENRVIALAIDRLDQVVPISSAAAADPEAAYVDAGMLGIGHAARLHPRVEGDLDALPIPFVVIQAAPDAPRL